MTKDPHTALVYTGWGGGGTRSALQVTHGEAHQIRIYTCGILKEKKGKHSWNRNKRKKEKTTYLATLPSLSNRSDTEVYMCMSDIK